MDYLSAVKVLRGIPIFGALDPAKLKLLAFASEAMTFRDGEILFREGDPADCAFLIEDGEVDICVDSNGNPLVVERLGRHDVFGEMAIFRDAPRVATVKARGVLKVLRIDGDMFLRFVTENPETALGVMRMLSEKIARATERYEALEDRVRSLQSFTERPPGGTDR